MLKTDSHLPKKILFICFNDSPSKMMINAFYFVLKAFFILKIFKFSSWLFEHVEKKTLIRKITLISKFMTSPPCQQRIRLHILLNISRIKGKQTMKFSQLIEYNHRNIFLQKSWRNWGRKSRSRLLFGFLKSFTLGKSKRSAAWFHYILIAFI